MEFRFSLSRTYLVSFLLYLMLGTVQAQEARLKSIQSIYNRPDQAKIRLKVGTQNSSLLIDLSNLGLENKPDKKEFLDMVSQNKVSALQPASFKREESDSAINLASRKALPDEFRIENVTYYKSQVDLGSLNGKKLTTEVYLAAYDEQELNPDLKLNFNWSTLKINKTCPKPVCQEWKIKDGKAVCKRVKCD